MTKGNERVETSGRRRKRSICYFLLSLLEDKSYPHVQWTNKENGEFEIHWMHASSGAWVMNNDAETFRLWAKAKGKFQGREDNYKTWKANFRCAMKSRHELEEIQLPECSSHKKKNLKFWRFKDMTHVNNYKGSESFDWSRSRTQPPSRKTTRVLRKRNRKIVDTDDTTESESESPPPSFDSYEPKSSSTQSVPNDRTRTSQDNSEAQQFARHEMKEDSNFNPYGIELLHILGQETADTDSVVPNVLLDSYSPNLLSEYQEGRTESSTFHQYNQLPAIHSFITELPFPDKTLLEQDLELFADEEKQLKRNGIATELFDTSSDNMGKNDDPFFYEVTYTELSRLGSYS